MSNSKVVGERSVVTIISKLLEFGCCVSIPIGDSNRYDLIVDTGDRLMKVQCKTAWLYNGCVVYNAQSITTKNGKYVSVPYTTDEIDLLLVYSPDLGKIYSVPIGLRLYLRVEAAKNSQQANIKWAKDYEFLGDVTQW